MQRGLVVHYGRSLLDTPPREITVIKLRVWERLDPRLVQVTVATTSTAFAVLKLVPADALTVFVPAAGQAAETVWAPVISSGFKAIVSVEIGSPLIAAGRATQTLLMMPLPVVSS